MSDIFTLYIYRHATDNNYKKNENSTAKINHWKSSNDQVEKSILLFLKRF